MHDIIETIDEYRVLVAADESPTEPYDDGGSPILTFARDYRYGWIEAEQLTSITSHKVDDSIIKALRKFGHSGLPWEPPLFERYLKMFHGARSVKWSNDYRGDSYVTFDTAEWREEMGLTDEYLARWEEAADQPIELASMGEYEAYLRGEAYGWIVQKKVRWVKVDANGERSRLDDDDMREEWEDIDSCWGYYDREYVEQEALAALQAEAV